MKFATFETDGRHSWGLVDGDSFRDLGARFPDLKAAIAAGALASLSTAAATSPVVAIAALRWLPVVPNPDKILCVGLNYEMHRAETGRAEVKHPTIFTRISNS